jgi:hypothetical protein
MTPMPGMSGIDFAVLTVAPKASRRDFHHAGGWWRDWWSEQTLFMGYHLNG